MEQIPTFRAMLDEETFTDETLKNTGRFAVVYFYPKDMTSGCTVEANDFESKRKEFAKLNCDIYGVSKDSCASHKKFATKEGLNFSLISDPTTEMCQAFGVWKEKKLYGKSYMGVDRSTFLIDPKGKILKAWRGVKIPGHVDEVLESLMAVTRR